MPEVASTDYYTLLGVPRNASTEEIHVAFRHLAHECHPDLHPGDPAAVERFKAINEAYHLLSNESERRAYDASLTTTETGHADLETTVELGLRELFTGCRVRIRVPRAAPCPSCEGEGSTLRPGRVVCNSCRGTGWGPEEVFLGVRTRESCYRCQGRGRLASGVGRSPCLPCHGVGWILLSSSTEVRLPPGLEDGQKLCVPGQGQPLLQGGQGDLFIRVHVRPGPWTRAGPDLVLDLPVPSRLLAHGGRAPLRTPIDDVWVTLPRRSHYGQVVGVPGKGVPASDGRSRGDLWVRLVPPKEGR